MFIFKQFSPIYKTFYTIHQTGVVSEFNDATNEITLELQNNKYNQVLQRPSKFSVILDDTCKEDFHQEETEDLQELPSPKQKFEDKEVENIVNYLNFIKPI